MRKTSGIHRSSKYPIAIRIAALRFKAKYGKCKKESKGNKIITTPNTERYTADSLKLRF